VVQRTGIKYMYMYSHFLFEKTKQKQRCYPEMMIHKLIRLNVSVELV